MPSAIAIRLTPEGERRLAEVVTALQAQRQQLVASLQAAADDVREIAAADDRAERAQTRARRPRR